MSFFRPARLVLATLATVALTAQATPAKPLTADSHPKEILSALAGVWTGCTNLPKTWGVPDASMSFKVQITSDVALETVNRFTISPTAHAQENCQGTGESDSYDFADYYTLGKVATGDDVLANFSPNYLDIELIGYLPNHMPTHDDIEIALATDGKTMAIEEEGLVVVLSKTP